MDAYHATVMPEECVAWIAAEKRRVVVDATAGHGGHALLLAHRMGAGSTIVVMDARPEALAVAVKRLEGVRPKVVAIEGNYRRLPEALRERGIEEADGVLYDQGLSSADFEGGLGYSFRQDGPLDMRRDATARASAAELVATLSARELARLFREYGDEKWADRIAQYIVEARRHEPIERTGTLVKLIEAAVPRAAWPPDTHVATRSLMALRFAVNDDVRAIEESIRGVTPMLSIGARIACLSFCSTEDRAVKNVFRSLESPCVCPKDLPVCGCGKKPLLRVLTRRPLRPAPEEMERNRRSRSALLRVAERV